MPLALTAGVESTQTGHYPLANGHPGKLTGWLLLVRAVFSTLRPRGHVTKPPGVSACSVILLFSSRE